MSHNPIYRKLINAKEWHTLRLRKLRLNPVCELCEEKDISRLATEVHHLTPVESVSTEAQMKRLMYDLHNLQSLCHACHVEAHRCLFSHSKESIKANNDRKTDRFVDKFL